ncbi:MAG: hypothetical protein IKA84_01270, partial [Clostridia bacterium]|nr:hypothetical protein [Clostridia bacterium]
KSLCSACGTICAESVYKKRLKSFWCQGFPEATFMSFGGSRVFFQKEHNSFLNYLLDKSQFIG